MQLKCELVWEWVGWVPVVVAVGDRLITHSSVTHFVWHSLVSRASICCWKCYSEAFSGEVQSASTRGCTEPGTNMPETITSLVPCFLIFGWYALDHKGKNSKQGKLPALASSLGFGNTNKLVTSSFECTYPDGFSLPCFLTPIPVIWWSTEVQMCQNEIITVLGKIFYETFNQCKLKWLH